VAVALSALATLWRESVDRVELKQAAMTAVGSVLADSLADAVQAGDRDALASKLASASRLPHIVHVVVEDLEGRTIAAAGDGLFSEAASGLPQGDGGRRIARLLSWQAVAVPIMDGSRQVGRLKIVADPADLHKALIDSIIKAIGAGSLAAALAVLISSRLRDFIAGPIQELTQAAESIRQSGDYSCPVPVVANDETGRLVEAFNAMMDEVRARDDALKRQRDHLAEEVAARTSELLEAKEAAERANAAKSDFLAAMSHEIRTPMNAMLVTAELLAAEQLDATARRRCETIVRSGQHLLAIINDILDLSKIEAGHLTLTSVPLSLGELVEDVIALYRERAAANSLAIEFQKDEATPPLVLGDPVRLAQVLSNLVSNAVKFTRKGSITIGLQRCSRQTTSSAAGVRISVTDTGEGIAPDKLSTIFEAFTQIETTAARREGGTGIGLTICRRIVTAMGGEITVESAPGVGSTFSFAIPLVEPSAEECDSAKLPARMSDTSVNQSWVATHGQTYAGRRVLAADDSPVNRDVLEATLSRLGLTVVSVGDGKEAVQAFAAGRFDLIFMDGSMPVLNGFAAARQIRALEAKTGRPRTPIVALTAHVVGRHAEAWRESGMSDFVAKPFTLDVIERCVARWLSPSECASGTVGSDGNDGTGATDGVASLDPGHLNAAVLDGIADLAVGHDADLLARVIDLYVEHAPAALDALKTTIERSEASRNGNAREAVAAAAHALKSLSCNVGAVRVSEQCSAIEAAAQAGDEVSAAALIALDAAIEGAIAALRARYHYYAENGLSLAAGSADEWNAAAQGVACPRLPVATRS